MSSRKWFVAVSSWSNGEEVLWAEDSIVHVGKSFSHNLVDDEGSAVPVSGLAWVSKERFLVGADDGLIRVFVRRDEWFLWMVLMMPGPPNFLSESWCQSGRLLAELVIDDELARFGRVRTLPQGNAAVLIDEGRRCIVVGSKPTICECSFDTTRVNASTIIRGLAGAVWGALFSNEEERLVTSKRRVVDGVDVDAMMFSSDPESPGSSWAVFDDDSRKGASASTSPDGRLVAVGDDVGRVMLIDTRIRRLVRIFKGIREAQTAFCDSKGGLCLAILAPRRGFVRIFRMRFGGQVAALQLTAGKLYSWKFLTASPHGGGRGGVFIAAKAPGAPPKVARLKFDDDHDVVRGAKKAAYYASGGDAKAARGFRTSRREKDVGGAIAALAGIGDDLARAKALDEAARTETDASMLLALVTSQYDDTHAFARSVEAFVHLASVVVDQDAAATDESSATTWTAEASAWLDAAAVLDDEQQQTSSTMTIDEAASKLVYEAMKRLKIGETLAADVAAEADAIGRRAETKQETNHHPSPVVLYRGAAVWKAILSPSDDDAWRRALSTSFESALLHEDEQVVEASQFAPYLCQVAGMAANSLFGILVSGDVFGLRELSAAELALDLSHPVRCRACYSWFSSLSARRARGAREGPALTRWLKDAAASSVDEALLTLQPILECRLDATKPAHALAFTTAVLEVVERRSQEVEAKTYGDVSADSWGCKALASAVDELRVAALLQLGPPLRKDATVANIDSGRVLVSSVVAADAAAAPEDVSPDVLLDQIVGENAGLGLGLAKAAKNRRERGWLHAAFYPDLDPNALRIVHVLLSLPESIDALFASAHDLATVFAKEPRLRPLVVAAAADRWRLSAAPKLSEAMGPPHPEIPSLSDDDEEEDSSSSSRTALVEAAGILIDLFKQADQLGVLQSIASMTPDDEERSVASLIASGGSPFAVSTTSCWPSRDLGPQVAGAWADYREKPISTLRLAQLDALKRCLRLALEAQDLPLGCVAELFGLGEKSSDMLLQLETPPRDDVAAFADLAQATLQNAANDPRFANKLRLAHSRRSVPSLVAGKSSYQDHFSSRR